MAKRRTAPLPEICRHCEHAPRPPYQTMCRTCSHKYRVYATKAELVVARWVAHSIASRYDPTKALIMDVAVARMEQRKVLTTDERIVVGHMVWGYGEAVDRSGKRDPAMETLYRKMMGHDRRTMQSTPYPPLA